MPTLTRHEEEVAREVAEQVVRTRRTVSALGAALDHAHSDASPPLARAAQAERNLLHHVEEEFGLLTSSQAGARMGTRSEAQRNLALAARKDGRLLGLPRGRYVLFPGFQFDDHGLRSVIADLIELGRKHNRTEVGLIQWLMSPTTYLHGQRPVDIIEAPDRLLEVAAESFGLQW